MNTDPPTDDRTLAETWQTLLRESGNDQLSEADLEQARSLYMRGATAALYLLAVLAPHPATVGSIGAAVEQINNEIQKYVETFANPH